MDKKYLKQVALYVLTSILSVSFILYVGYHLFYGLTQKVETAPASPETVGSTLTADAYLFREETVLHSTTSGGSVVAAVTDGERVGVGDTVAHRYDVSSPDVVAAIAEANEQIRVLTAMRENALSVRDTVSIDKEIYDIMQKIAASAEAGDAAGALSLRSSLRAALTKRAVVTGAKSDIEGEIAKMQAEKDALTNKLGTRRETSTVAKSGYFFADTDGYESVFTAERALSMSVADFRALCAENAKEPSATAIGKLVTDYVWYAACLVPFADTKNLTEGDTYPVSFSYNGDKTVEMSLTRLVRDGDTALLVFAADTMPQGFTYTRLQPIVITDNAYTGLRVPASALRVVDGVTGVYVLEGSVMHYRAVKLLIEGEDWCLLETAPEEDPPEGYVWLKQNEIVITKGRRLAEGRILS